MDGNPLNLSQHSTLIPLKKQVTLDVGDARPGFEVDVEDVDFGIEIKAVHGVLTETLLSVLLGQFVKSQSFHARFNVYLQNWRHCSEELVQLNSVIEAESYFDYSGFNCCAPERKSQYCYAAVFL
jgi:hypothetical protein